MKNRLFPPRPKKETQTIRQEHNCGRTEIRALDLLEVAPAQVDFPGARLAARLVTRTLRKGKWTETIVYLLSSLTRDQLQAEGLLALKRGYWVIESRLHHCLDITMQEDLSRVRTPNSARVLGTIRRILITFSNAAIDQKRKQNPKAKCSTKSFRQRFLSACGGPQRLDDLIFSNSPEVLSL